MGSNVGVTAIWLALLALTAWRIAVLVRSTAPTPRQKAVTALFIIAALSNTFRQPFVRRAVSGIQPGLGFLLSHIFLMLLFSGFIYLFASGERDRPAWLRSFPVQVGIAGVASFVFAILWAITPDADKPVDIVDLGRQLTPLPYIGVFVFVIYALYGTFTAGALAWSEAAHSIRFAKWGYRLGGAGIIVSGVGAALRLPAALDAWTTRTPTTHAQDQANLAVTFSGIGVLLIGLLLVAAHRTLEERRALLALRPLYTALCMAQPQIALHLPRTYLREFLLLPATLRDQ